jgi:hypothetical protein
MVVVVVGNNMHPHMRNDNLSKSLVQIARSLEGTVKTDSKIKNTARNKFKLFEKAIIN